MSIKSKRHLAFFLATLIAVQLGATVSAAPNCSYQVSREMVTLDADWVVEGAIMHSRFGGEPNIISNQTKVLKQGGARLHDTIALLIDPCFKAEYKKKWAATKKDTRLRMYGRQGHGERHITFIEPVSARWPVQKVSVIAAGATASAPLPASWEEARSEQGGFSIHLPPGVEQYSGLRAGRMTHMLRAKGSDGTLYLAVLEEPGEKPGVDPSREEGLEWALHGELGKPGARRGILNGMKLVDGEGSATAKDVQFKTHWRFMETPKGSLMLSVALAPGSAGADSAFVDHFLNSFALR